MKIEIILGPRVPWHLLETLPLYCSQLVPLGPGFRIQGAATPLVAEDALVDIDPEATNLRGPTVGECRASA
jgi:hypothetical protein